MALAIERGWQPWQRNLRVGRCEVDLAMRRQGQSGLQLLVAEVKTSRRPILEPLRRWSAAQQRRLWAAAAALSEQTQADRVEVALVLVCLAADQRQITWFVAEPPA